jgi:O-antigen ligase
METSKKEKRNSLAVSIYIFETVICQIIGGVITVPYISVSVMLLLFLYVIINNHSFNVEKLKVVFITFIAISVVLGVSIIKNGLFYAGLYTIYFVVFGATALIISITEFSYYWIIIYSLRISIIYELMYFLLLRKQLLYADDYWTLQMGTAYSFLTPAVVSLLVIMKNRAFGFRKKYVVLSTVNLFISSYVILIDCGTRGAIVSLAVAFVLIYISRLRSIKKVITIVIVSILVYIVFQNFELVLVHIDNILTMAGIKVSAISKMITWMNTGVSLYNGRDTLYELAKEIFLENPLFGHGVGYYESKDPSGGYVHNLFWQMLCEVGILGSMPFIIVFINDVWTNFIRKNLQEGGDAFRVLLFLITIPLLMFSSAYWLLPSFWLYLWMIIIKMNFKRRI